MKIIQLVTKRQYRGAEVFAAELSSILGKRGHDILFVGLYPPPKNVLSAQHSQNIDLNGRKRWLSIGLLLKLIRLIRNTRPEIIQANGSDTLKYVVMAKLFLPKLKITYRNISMVSSWTKGNSTKKKLNQLLFNKVDKVVLIEPLHDLVFR